MSMPKSTGDTPPARRTLLEHWGTRAAAERHRAAAQREFNSLQREVRRNVRSVRRDGRTAAIVLRAKLARSAVTRLTHLVARARTGREES
jgi:hypothetical protein